VDAERIRQIVRRQNKNCLFGITDSFNLGYGGIRQRKFDFVTQALYYDGRDVGGVFLYKFRPGVNYQWVRKNADTAMEDVFACDILADFLPYLKVFDKRYAENIQIVEKALAGKATLKRIDLRHREINFRRVEDLRRFLRAIEEVADTYDLDTINEYTALKVEGKRLVLRVGIENFRESRSLRNNLKGLRSTFRGWWGSRSAAAAVSPSIEQAGATRKRDIGSSHLNNPLQSSISDPDGGSIRRLTSEILEQCAVFEHHHTRARSFLKDYTLCMYLLEKFLKNTGRRDECVIYYNIETRRTVRGLSPHQIKAILKNREAKETYRIDSKTIKGFLAFLEEFVRLNRLKRYSSPYAAEGEIMAELVDWIIKNQVPKRQKPRRRRAAAASAVNSAPARAKPTAGQAAAGPAVSNQGPIHAVEIDYPVCGGSLKILSRFFPIEGAFISTASISEEHGAVDMRKQLTMIDSVSARKSVIDASGRSCIENITRIDQWRKIFKQWVQLKLKDNHAHFIFTGGLFEWCIFHHFCVMLEALRETGQGEHKQYSLHLPILGTPRRSKRLIIGLSPKVPEKGFDRESIAELLSAANVAYYRRGRSYVSYKEALERSRLNYSVYFDGVMITSNCGEKGSQPLVRLFLWSDVKSMAAKYLRSPRPGRCVRGWHDPAKDLSTTVGRNGNLMTGRHRECIPPIEAESSRRPPTSPGRAAGPARRLKTMNPQPVKNE
jgi:hypothetical protein